LCQVSVTAFEQSLNTSKPTRACNPHWVKAQVLVKNLAQSAMAQPQWIQLATAATDNPETSFKSHTINSQPQQQAARSVRSLCRLCTANSWQPAVMSRPSSLQSSTRQILFLCVGIPNRARSAYATIHNYSLHTHSTWLTGRSNAVHGCTTIDAVCAKCVLIICACSVRH
jgi:hypothetical protein